MVVSHRLLPGFRNRPCWDRPSLQQLLRFGKWIFVSTLCTFLADQTDRLVVGKVTSLVLLGLYQIAHQLASLPLLLLSGISEQVVLPLYSRQNQSRQGITPGIRWLHPLLTGFGACAATGLFVTGPLFIACLYGDRYQGAGWMVRILAVGAFFKVLASASSTALLALGQSRGPAIANGTKALALVVLLPVGYFFGGLTGLLGALVVADVLRYVIIVSALSRRGQSVLRCDLTLFLCAVIFGAGAYYASRQPWLAANNWVAFGVAASVILLCWAGVFLVARARPAVWGWAAGSSGAAPPPDLP
jgi:O-antigen/teichoic acid export membrane protein